LLLFPVALLGLGVILFFRWRKRRAAAARQVVAVERVGVERNGAERNGAERAAAVDRVADTPGAKRNAVYVLGEFAVFDRRGNDITHLFSPKIKQLFVLILLNSQDGKGISSRKISARLWPEKDLAKTKNIKGVTFNHLRAIIGDIDGIELVFLNDSYSFRLDAAFFCDFCVLSELFRTPVEGAGIMDQFHLIARGPLLPEMPEALVDDCKSGFETQLMELLLPELKRAYEAREFKLALEIAKRILDMDAFNEEALKYQLRSFRRLRGIDYSRKAYDQFTQDYERSLGVAFHVSYDKLVQ